MLRISQLKLKIDQKETEGAKASALKEKLARKAAGLLRIPVQDIISVEILRQSIDARKKPELFYIYTVDVQIRNEDKVIKAVHKRGGAGNQVEKAAPGRYRFPGSGTKEQAFPTVIAGMGPAGLFCGYFLALHGYRPVLLERGKKVEERQRDVEAFWESGVLNPASNVQFGEGGAGTFSDGKLNTLVKDKDGRNRAVLETLVRFGAKESILYEAKPHIGTDGLSLVVKAMREEIIRLGGTVRFESQVTDIRMEENRVKSVIINGGEELFCGQLVLAVGHSARDTFSMLYDRAVPMEAKAFAVGFRVEHPQKMINFSQYGMENPGGLGAAPYKVTARTSMGRGVYSFCMCPGGYVVNASSEEGHLAVNGMSYSGRGGSNANSAVIVAVTPEDYGSRHPLAGVAFQRELERRAFLLGGGKIPIQRYGDFRRCVERTGLEGMEAEDAHAMSSNAEDAGAAGSKAEDTEAMGCSVKDTGAAGSKVQDALQPQCKGACAWADISSILPEECSAAFLEGMEAFGRQIAGFDRPDAILSGVESRTSSPVRIHRDESLQSAVRGLYPCGEGAGYAGGITSAAMDGIRVAEAIASEYAPSRQLF